MSEMTISKPFLMAILNEALRSGRPNLAVSSVFLDLDLMGVNLKASSIEWVVERDRFDRAYSEVQARLGEPMLVKEIPSYPDLKDALQSSLLVPPENLGQMMSEIRDIEKRRRGSSRNPKQTLVAIDTNLAYHRLFSRLLLSSDACGVPDYDPSKVQIILENLVELEIADRVNRKYRDTDLEVLKKAFKNPKLAGTLANCLLKDGRKAMNAQTEILAMKGRYAIWEVAGGSWNEDKEKRDGEILRSLAHHAQEERVELLFLTADDKASATAQAVKVGSFVLRYPHELPRSIPYDPWLFVELLYDLAIVFGVISLRPLGIRIHGDWAGKTADDYHQEKVKLAFEETSPLGETLAREHRVLDRLGREFDLSSLK